MSSARVHCQRKSWLMAPSVQRDEHRVVNSACLSYMKDQRVAELPDHFEAPNTEPFDKVKTDTIRNCVTVPNGTAASAAP